MSTEKALPAAKIDATVNRILPEEAILLTRAGWQLNDGDVAGAVRLAQRAEAIDFSLKYLPMLFQPDPIDSPPPRVYEKIQRLIAGGFAPPRFIDFCAVTATKLGLTETVRHLLDYEHLLRVTQLNPPHDPDLSLLSLELKQEKVYFENPDNRAIRSGWRRNDLKEGQGSPVIQRMFAQFRQAMNDYCAALPDDPRHPFIASRPKQFRLLGWSVISGSDTYHHSHLHPESWANGVYYIDVPPIVGETNTHAGWLHIGPPPKRRFGINEGWAEQWIRPEPGMLVLLPSYFHHATLPLEVNQDRLCVAFEVHPVKDGE